MVQAHPTKIARPVLGITDLTDPRGTRTLPFRFLPSEPSMRRQKPKAVLPGDGRRSHTWSKTQTSKAGAP